MPSWTCAGQLATGDAARMSSHRKLLWGDGGWSATAHISCLSRVQTDLSCVSAFPIGHYLVAQIACTVLHGMQNQF